MRLLVLIFVLCTTPLSAAIEFPDSTQNFQASPTQEEIVATYHFTNSGPDPVTIDRVQTSCGCTTAALEKSTYGPGESGHLEARFHIGTRVGLQEKSISVFLGGKPDQPVVLHLNVQVPAIVTLDPQFLVWPSSENLEPRQVHATVGQGIPAKILAVTSDNPMIEVAVKELLPGRDLEVTVKPKEGSKRIGATLVFRTDFPAGAPRNFYVIARVK